MATVIPWLLRFLLEAQTTVEERCTLACTQTQGQLPFFYNPGRSA